MAVRSGEAAPGRVPYRESGETNYDIEPGLGYVRATVGAPADWNLPAVEDLVRGATLCIINPTGYQITLHAALGDIIETPGGSGTTETVEAGSGTQLCTQPGGWLRTTLLGTKALVKNAPGGGHPLVDIVGTASTVKRLEAGAGMTITDTGTSAQVSTGLAGQTTNNLSWVGVETMPTTVGTGNSGFGYRAGYNETTVSGNSALGTYSLYWNTTGTDNTAVGNGAMGSHPFAVALSGAQFRNVAVGRYAMALFQTTATENTAFGAAALKGADPAAITPTQNTAVGTSAVGVECANNVHTSTNSCFLGRDVFKYGGTNVGEYYQGYFAGMALVANIVSNTSQYNTCVGRDAMRQTGGGARNWLRNSAYGSRAGRTFDAGAVDETCVGYDTLTVAIGPGSTAVGRAALRLAQGSTANTGLGFQVCQSNATGTACTGVGTGALQLASSVSSLTAVGNLAGESSTNTTANTCLGASAGPNTNALSGCLVLGLGAKASTGSQWAMGAAATPIVTSLTVGAAGAAAALPAKPNTYAFIRLNGTTYRMPMYL